MLLNEGAPSKASARDIKLIGLGINNREVDISQKLGEPTTVSIDSEGLKKSMSFPRHNVSFVVGEGDIKYMCIANKPVTFLNEYSPIAN